MRRLIGIGGASAVLLLFLLTQLFLPGFAADQLRDRLSKNGKVREVSISAFPAIELLWHDADKVIVHMASYRSSTAKLSTLLDEAAGVGTIHASATVLTAGLLTVHNATLDKRGSELTGAGSVTQSDLRAAIPFLDSVQPIASGNGQLVVRGTATLFGVSAAVDATVAVSNGRLVVAPDVPFGGLATITLFSDPHVRIQGVAATPTPGGFTISARARLS
jgi:hypothetical protein